MFFLGRHRIASLVSLLAIVLLSVLGVFVDQHLSKHQAATEHERQRASELESRADTIASVYQNELAQSAQSRKQLAHKLATSANSLKNLGIFEMPSRTVREAKELATTALTLDPDCSRARVELFSLNCISLDFHTARTLTPLPEDYRFADYLAFAEAFPSYSFNERHRPRPQQLAAFFLRAREINPERGPLMERILSYDVAVRGKRRSSKGVVSAVVCYLNGGPDHIITDFRREDSTLLLWSDRNVRLLIPKGSGSGRCLLRYLPFRNLELNIAGQFELSDLHLLQIESLDLRKCRNLSLRQSVSLPLLRRIHLHPGSLPPQTIRRLVQSSKSIEILTEDVSPASQEK